MKKLHSLLFSAAALLLAAACTTTTSGAPPPESMSGRAHYDSPGPRNLGTATWSRADSPGGAPIPGVMKRAEEKKTPCARVMKETKAKKAYRKKRYRRKPVSMKKAKPAVETPKKAPPDRNAPPANGGKKGWWFN